MVMNGVIAMSLSKERERGRIKVRDRRKRERDEGEKWSELEDEMMSKPHLKEN